MTRSEWGGFSLPPLADRVTALQMHNVNRIEFAYDGFGRVTGRTYSNTSGANRRVTTYTYQDVGTDKTTTLLKSVNNSGFGELGYEYDAVGNITQITKDGTVQETYTYDSLNQLKTVTRNGVTTEYNYQNGNITSVTQNGTVIKTYGYTDSTWSDLLTSFNGQTITYDEIGNPLQYRNGMSFTWAKGRQLQSVTKDGLTASYTYDENGLRLSKTVNGVTTNIFRANGQMVGMNSSDGKDMTFILDGNGNVYGVHYDHYSSNQPKSETYYFAYNAQGDVIGIYEFSGRLMATYDYDEWGNCTVNVLAADNNGHAVDSPDHIAYANPFRYRGYFYDAETGFYYLNSRYYDPGTGRFVNADESIHNTHIMGMNLFTYCANNSICYHDPNGKWFGIDDVITGPFDEIFVFGALIILGLLGVTWAQAMSEQITTGIIDLISEMEVLLTKQSGKEKSNDVPSWAKHYPLDTTKSAQQNAANMLDDKYGKGNWGKGPGSEFNKITKWLSRSKHLIIIPDELDYSGSFWIENYGTVSYLMYSYGPEDLFIISDGEFWRVYE